jgi:hypothetical protein
VLIPQLPRGLELCRERRARTSRRMKTYDRFAQLFYLSIAQRQREARVGPADRQYLGRSVFDEKVGENLRNLNPEIAKYFGNTKTDPASDRKGRCSNVSPVEEHASSWSGTAWCAAFVNWWSQAGGRPHLGYATAASRLRFATPLPGSKYECGTMVPPATSTGSTTGHVASDVETKGNTVALLGGNQGHEVNIRHFVRVTGYGWPTEFNYDLPD